MSVGHYENFPVASLIVPARYRRAIVAIYRFARGADDIADEGDDGESERLRALDDYASALDAIERGETPVAFADLAHTIRAYALPIALFRDLLSAFRQDVSVQRYATYADVLDYCSRSANPIGRLLLTLFRADSDANLAASDAVCSGLQLANFWQDVGSDHARGRIYVPIEDLQRFGVTETQLADRRVDANWRALMAFETCRTRSLLDAGAPLGRALPLRLALEIRAVIAGGKRVLDRIDAAGGDVFHSRTRLVARDWVAVAFRAIVPARARPRRAPA